MLEGVFEINRGSLRRAWAVYRRAMTAAQLMGIHRQSMSTLQRIDPDLTADPEILWFRIVYVDRYLSLLLGLPQGTLDEKMGAPPALRHETPLGKFERQLTVIASRILERNDSLFTASNLTITRSIDAELLSVSKGMPAAFWRPANFQNLTPGSPESLPETLRLAAQVYYYSLLIQLHLPYMMRAEGNTENDYSKVTCVNASREIMTRFIAHRSFNPMSSCSRPVDFFALLAGMTLLLAHLDAHHRREEINFLAHQRLIDRAMLDQALERMDVIRQVSKDVVAEKSASLIRRLLAIEADAAEGVSFSARAVEGQDHAREGTGESEALRLHIPYLGVIKIDRQGPISRESSLRNVASRPRQGSQVNSLQKGPFATPYDVFTPASPTSTTVRQGFTSPGARLYDPTFSGDLLASEGPQVPLQAFSHQYSMLQCVSPGDDDTTFTQEVGLPPVAADADEWAFQGVDMAFFDSLMRGTSSLDATGLE